MIIHETENGQRVAFGTAERSEIKDGFLVFYDQNENEVGRQPISATEKVDEIPEVAPTAPPVEPPLPPVVAAAVPEHGEPS